MKKEQGMTLLETTVALCLLLLAVQAVFLSSDLAHQTRVQTSRMLDASTHLESLLQRMAHTDLKASPTNDLCDILCGTSGATEAKEAYVKACYEMDKYRYVVSEIELPDYGVQKEVLAACLGTQAQWLSEGERLSTGSWEALLTHYALTFGIEQDARLLDAPEQTMLIGVVYPINASQQQPLAMQWCIL